MARPGLELVDVTSCQSNGLREPAKASGAVSDASGDIFDAEIRSVENKRPDIAVLIAEAVSHEPAYISTLVAAMMRRRAKVDGDAGPGVG